MNREEAIKFAEYAQIMADGKPDVQEFYKLAESALRQQETVANRNDPLTMEELRQMDGEPVWVQSPGIPEYGRWAIVEGAGENCLFLHDDFTCHDYGKTWLAYRQKQEEGTL